MIANKLSESKHWSSQRIGVWFEKTFIFFFLYNRYTVFNGEIYETLYPSWCLILVISSSWSALLFNSVEQSTRADCFSSQECVFFTEYLRSLFHFFLYFGVFF